MVMNHPWDAGAQKLVLGSKKYLRTESSTQKLFLGPPDTFLRARTAVAQVMHINPVDGNLYLSCRRWPGVILSFRQKVTAMTGSVEWQCRMTVSPRRRASMNRHCALSLSAIVCH